MCFVCPDTNISNQRKWCKGIFFFFSALRNENESRRSYSLLLWCLASVAFRSKGQVNVSALFALPVAIYTSLGRSWSGALVTSHVTEATIRGHSTGLEIIRSVLGSLKPCRVVRVHGEKTHGSLHRVRFMHETLNELTTKFVSTANWHVTTSHAAVHGWWEHTRARSITTVAFDSVRVVQVATFATIPVTTESTASVAGLSVCIIHVAALTASPVTIDACDGNATLTRRTGSAA